MPRIQIPMGESSYQSEAMPFSAQRCVNMFASPAEAQSLDQVALFNTPGLVQLGTAGTQKSRGSHAMGGVLFMVTGVTLYSVDSVGAVTNLGSIPGDKRVQFADNGTKMVVMNPGTQTGSNPDAYVWDSVAVTLTQITDADFGAGSSTPGFADTVCWIDGYYVFTATAGDIFWHSDINDPLAYNALFFSTADIKPDPIVGCHVNHNQLFILGSETIEVFQNIAGADFVFQRIPGANMQAGTVSKYSPVDAGGTFFYVGGDTRQKPGVYMVTSSTSAQKVSTDAIDYQIQRFSSAEWADSFSYTFGSRGHEFACFSFESVDQEAPEDIKSRTFCYNITSSNIMGRPIWFELQSGTLEDRWRVASIDKAYGRLLVTDNRDGRIGYIDNDTFTEYGDVIVREKTLAPFTNGGVPVFVSELELVANSGAGLITGQGSDPQVFMDWSDDGARTWSSDITRPLGKIGEYSRRTVWRRLGRVPSNRVFRIRASDPVQMDWLRVDLEVT